MQDKIENYLKMDEIEIEEDPFKWCCVNKNRLPTLANLARKYLGIPATSTPSERLFSHASLVMTNKRTQLSHNTFEKILFLKRNVYDHNVVN
jgi:hypothetical protein